MGLAEAKSKARPRMDGAPLKLISTGWSRRSTAIFGSKEPSPRWVPWQQPTWASAFGAVLSHASDQKWQARFFLFFLFFFYIMWRLLLSLLSILRPLLFSPRVTWSLFAREGVRRLQRVSVCGKMLPDNQSSMWQWGQAYTVWDKKGELVGMDCQSCAPDVGRYGCNK